MRKMLLGVAMVAALFCSCSQEQDERERVNEVAARIGWDIQQSGLMTRAVTGDAVQQKIRAMLPTDAELNDAGIKITRQADNTQLDARLGQTQTLKIGAYSCAFRWEPSGISKSGGVIQRIPSFDINAQFSVTPDVVQYTLPAVFDCAALAWDNTLFELKNGDTSLDAIWQPTDDVSVVFIRNLDGVLALNFTLVPKDYTEYSELTLTLTRNNVEYGRYYLLRCPGSSQEGVTSVAFEDFLAGTL